MFKGNLILALWGVEGGKRKEGGRKSVRRGGEKMEECRPPGPESLRRSVSPRSSFFNSFFAFMESGSSPSHISSSTLSLMSSLMASASVLSLMWPVQKEAANNTHFTSHGGPEHPAQTTSLQKPHNKSNNNKIRPTDVGTILTRSDLRSPSRKKHKVHLNLLNVNNKGNIFVKCVYSILE